MLRLTHYLQTPAATVYNCLANAEKFVRIHPLIYKAEPLGGNAYLLYERIAIGPVSVPFTYPARFTGSASCQSVTMQATIFKLVRVELLFEIGEANGQTVVEETVWFHSVLPLAWAIKPIFRQQHKAMFAKLEMIAG